MRLLFIIIFIVCSFHLYALDNMQKMTLKAIAQTTPGQNMKAYGQENAKRYVKLNPITLTLVGVIGSGLVKGSLDTRSIKNMQYGYWRADCVENWRNDETIMILSFTIHF